MSQNTLLVIVLGVVGLVVAAIFLIPTPAPEPARVIPTPDQASASASTGLADVLAPDTSAEGASMPVADHGEAAEAENETVVAANASASRHVIATYFHNTARCVTCRNIEDRSRGAIEAAFAPELASGQLTWRALNMEKKENEHYVIDYDLPYASLVVAEMDGDREVRFKVLEETWDLVHKRQPLLEDYITYETRAYLEGR